MTVAIKHIEETKVRVEAGSASLEGNLRLREEVVQTFCLSLLTGCQPVLLNGGRGALHARVSNRNTGSGCISCPALHCRRQSVRCGACRPSFQNQSHRRPDQPRRPPRRIENRQQSPLLHRQQRDRRLLRTRTHGAESVPLCEKPWLRVSQGRVWFCGKDPRRDGRRRRRAPDQASQRRRAPLSDHRRRHLCRQRTGRRAGSHPPASSERPSVRPGFDPGGPVGGGKSIGSGATRRARATRWGNSKRPARPRFRPTRAASIPASESTSTTSWTARASARKCAR